MAEKNVIEFMIAYGIIKKSSVTGKYYSACHMNEELTTEVNLMKKEFGIDD